MTIKIPKQIKDYIPDLALSAGFILAATIVSTTAYVFISSFIYRFLVRKYWMILIAKFIKILTAFLLVKQFKNTVKQDLMDEGENLIKLLTISLINTFSIAFINLQTDVYRIYGGVINLMLITLTIFIIEILNNNMYLNYYIDGKIVQLIYFTSLVLDHPIIFFVFNIVVALKLISIYNSTHFIIKNQIKNCYFYLFFIYMHIINRYIDINHMLY